MASGVSQQVKPPLTSLASHPRVLDQGPAALLPVQLPANVPMNTEEDGPST